MNDMGKVIVGLAVFLALSAYPFWHALTASEQSTPPELELPTDSSRCVEDTAYMTANHMDLLNQWRDAVVRDGERDYTSTSGERYEMSLTKTCMGCHDDRGAFCTRCHDYADVQPQCWNCHVEPGGN